MEKPTICPQCGHPLKERQRKDGSGSFLGCIGYPNCKFIYKDPLAPPSFIKRGSKVTQVAQMQENKARLINQAMDRKEESIAKFNAINSAIALICHHPAYRNMLNEKQILDKIFALQLRFFKHNSKSLEYDLDIPDNPNEYPPKY